LCINDYFATRFLSSSVIGDLTKADNHPVIPGLTQGDHTPPSFRASTTPPVIPDFDHTPVIPDFDHTPVIPDLIRNPFLFD